MLSLKVAGGPGSYIERESPFMDISVGIISYNDINNIRNLAEYFLEYRSDRFHISEVIIVSTAECSSLVDVLKELQEEFGRFSYVLQSERKGKSSAIDLFLKTSRSPIVLLCSGDVYPAKESLDALIDPFHDPEVGMTGGQVVPFHNVRSFASHLDIILWKLHHLMASRRPKLGEMVAFRNLIKTIPDDIAVDEAYIEHIISKKGYKISYQPAAVIYNYTYEHMRDFLKKRVRINLGHRHLQERYGYKVSSQFFYPVFLSVIKTFCQIGFIDKFYLLLLVFLEVYSRAVAWILFVFGYNHTIWFLPGSKAGIDLLKVVGHDSQE